MIEGHPAILFDAWKNDFTADPLLAFIAEFDDGLKSYSVKVPLSQQAKSKLKRLMQRLWKPALVVLAGAAVKQVSGISLSHIKERLGEDEVAKAEPKSDGEALKKYRMT